MKIYSSELEQLKNELGFYLLLSPMVSQPFIFEYDKLIDLCLTELKVALCEKSLHNESLFDSNMQT